MLITIKASKKEAVLIHEFFNKVTIVVGRQLELPVNNIILKRILHTNINWLTGKLEIRIHEDFLTEIMDIIGDTILMMLLFRKNVDAIKEKIGEFYDKYVEDESIVEPPVDKELSENPVFGDNRDKGLVEKTCVLFFEVGDDSGKMNEYVCDTYDEADDFVKNMGTGIELFGIKRVLVDKNNKVVAYL